MGLLKLSSLWSGLRKVFQIFSLFLWLLPERVGGGGIEGICGCRVILANNREAKLEREITASREGEEGNEPLDQSQETSGLLQRLRIKWHFYGF